MRDSLLSPFRNGSNRAIHVVERAVNKVVASRIAPRLQENLARLTRPIVDIRNRGVTVCIASYQARFPYAAIAIESIGEGFLKPGRMVLVIDELDVVTGQLSALQLRGLEIIRGRKALGPHNKWYPFAKSMDDSRSTLITADDDIIYPSNWLVDILRASSTDRIATYRAHPILTSDDGLEPYSKWVDFPIGPRHSLFITGVSGAAYPYAFVQDALRDGEVFLETCPRADDVWLTRTALRYDWPITLVHRRPVHFPIIPNSQSSSLQSSNVHQNENDIQILRTFSAGDISKIQQNQSY